MSARKGKSPAVKSWLDCGSLAEGPDQPNGNEQTYHVAEDVSVGESSL
jgi:hypothetical protein